MRHLILFLLALISFANLASGQALKLVSTSGTYTETASGSVSWSVGEVMIVTAVSGANDVTQGFHNSNIWVTGVEELVELNISVYPNPTCELVNIEAPLESILSIYDMEGRLISTHFLNETNHQIDVSEFSRGVYNLSFRTKDSAIKTVKLIVQ